MPPNVAVKADVLAADIRPPIVRRSTPTLRGALHLTKAAITALAIVTVACTYGPPEDHLQVQNVALKSDGRLLAAVVKYERYQPATGFAAFPDGGVPRIHEQRADLYVLDLQTHALVFQGGIPAPSNRRLSFSPWLMGWADERVYFKITGCPGSPGSECYGPLVGTSVFTLTPEGTIVESRAPSSISLQSTVSDGTTYVSAGTEPYGVSVGYKPGAPRSPALRFAGTHLKPLVP